MNNVPSGEQPVKAPDELLPEYHFDYSKARPNRFAASSPPGGRTPNLRDQIESIRNKIAQFTRDRELAAAKVDELNPVIKQLHDSKLLEAGVVVVGDVIDSVRNHAFETDLMTLAAIEVPGGLGTVFMSVPWDEEEGNIPSGFTPFEACKPAVQARLLPHIEKLFTSLVAKVDTTTRSA